MAATASPYGKFLLGLGTGVFDFSSDSLKALLTTVSYVPDVDTDQFIDDVTSEIVGTGYTAGGKALTGLAWTYNSGSNWAQLVADPLVWTTATFTMRRAVIYKDTGTPSTSPLIGWIDYGTNQNPAAEDFTLSFPSDIVARVRAA